MERVRTTRLRKLIAESFGGSQAALAERTGVSRSQIGQYLGGQRNLGEKVARKIEAATGKPSGWLDAPHANVTLAAIGSRRVPLINYVQAGAWTGIADNIQHIDADEWLLTDLELSDGAFGLEIKGESMLPNFRPGDRIIVDPAIAPSPGDFVVARNDDDEATFKKYRLRSIDKRGNQVFDLVPLNPDFETLHSDDQPIIIVGTMVEHRQYRRR